VREEIIVENDYHYQLRSCVTNPNTRIQFWLSRLKDSGYRLTLPRQAVVETLAASRHALSPTDVYHQARQASPGLGLVSVYRTLEKLEELKLVSRVHQADGCHSYIAAADGHQHLLICTRCSKVEYFSGDDLAPLIEALGAERGFIILDHWLQLSGVCSECQAIAGQNR
jgi:Fur family transcriptional regulator, ferric uptake regulator